MRKLALLGVVGVAAVAAVGAAPAGAASGGCQLQGNANFTPGLGSTSQPFSYNFGGNLTGCQSTDATAPASGVVSAGQTITLQVHNSVTGATDTVAYQEPTPTGAGGCSNSTTSGTAIVTWKDGSTTVMTYSTTGAAAAVNLSGSVIPSVTVTNPNAPAGDPASVTVSTTRYAGATAQGVLAFQPPDPTACTAGGVTTAGISGFVGLNG